MSFLIQESDAYVPIRITSKCNDKRLNIKVEYIYIYIYISEYGNAVKGSLSAPRSNQL